ncbi:hypothetical protein K435DRAFT_959830 [Dendrothele bispora CBS 962.96]|uniref:Transmembrane protein n=1 Tax=Dendrothele bispora (strain CBS 962.96) TaxID=1314807 RepID=A0A4S8MVQ4_DENBC|nr:hypothetical protein K435DRAFT_959830 [Dendrothele bispora CBS 962.96]
MPSLLFPSAGLQVFSSLIHFLGITIVSHCLSRKLFSERLSWAGIRQLPWPRLCLILVFLDSWLFLISSGILVFGVGLELHYSVCTTAIILCIAFYATTKALVYFYLIEKVHIVWAPPTGRSRFRSPVDIVCFLTVSLYAVVIGLMIFGRVARLRSGDNVCVIGLRPFSSIPLLAYDMYINIFLTGMFLYPILRAGRMRKRTRRLARRTLIATGVALTTSTFNIGWLFALKGQELGWICLGSCGVDVILNSYALYWSAKPRRDRDRQPTPSTIEGCISEDLYALKSRKNDPATIMSFQAGTPSQPLTRIVSPAIVPSSGAPKSILKPPRIHEHHFLHLPHFPHVHMPHLPHMHMPHLPHPHIRFHNPFASPVFVPQNPQPEVRISANPQLAQKPPTQSILSSLGEVLGVGSNKDENKGKGVETVQITVTTQVTHVEVGDDELHPEDVHRAYVHRPNLP